MSLNEQRLSQIKQLDFLAQTEDEKNVVIEAAKQICDAESDEAARHIADKYLKKMSAQKLTNMVDVIAILLKGGHISRFTPDFDNPKEEFCLMFIPVPDPPNQKTLIGHITQKQFNELCDKGIIAEREHLRHTDGAGRTYACYQLAIDIILRFRREPFAPTCVEAIEYGFRMAEEEQQTRERFKSFYGNTNAKEE